VSDRSDPPGIEVDIGTSFTAARQALTPSVAPHERTSTTTLLAVSVLAAGAMITGALLRINLTIWRSYQ